MKKILLMAVIWAPFVMLAGTVGAAPDSDRTEAVLFFDDFDGDEVDQTHWMLCRSAHPVWCRYFDDEAGWRNVRVENGELVLTADNEGRYRFGGIRTRGGFPLGTLVEVRARFTKVGGGFPAIWQMPVNGREWPKSGEIDLMEWVQGTPDRLHHTIHTFGTPGNPDKGTSRTSVMEETDEWHVYGAARTEDAVIFYLDGQELWRYENERLDDGGIQYPFTELDFDIILNNSLGGDGTWAGPIHDEDLPAIMRVDWVKVTRIGR